MKDFPFYSPEGDGAAAVAEPPAGAGQSEAPKAQEGVAAALDAALPGRSSDPLAGKPKWLSQLPPELRANSLADLEGYDSIGKLAEDTLSMKAKLGRAIIVPDMEKGTIEEKKAFLATMGIPETVEGYGIKAVEGLEEQTQAILPEFLKAGLTKTQAAKVYNLMVASGKAGSAQLEQAQVAAEAAFMPGLEQLVGKDQAPAVVTRFKKALVAMGDADIVKALGKTGLAFVPKFAIALASLVEKAGDHQFIEGSQQKPPEAPKKKGLGYSKDFDERYPPKEGQ